MDRRAKKDVRSRDVSPSDSPSLLRKIIRKEAFVITPETEGVKRKREQLTSATGLKRPAFSAGATRQARKRGRAIYPTISEDANHNDVNMAMPHRMSWKDIRDNANDDFKKNDVTGFMRWTDRFIAAGLERIKAGGQNSDLMENQARFVETRDAFAKTFGTKKQNVELSQFLTAANTFHANVPDIGPHKGVNNVVGERAHFNVLTVDNKRTLSPMSRRVAAMSPGRLSGIPVDVNNNLIDVRGDTHDETNWKQSDLDNIRRHQPVLIKKYKPNSGGGGSK